MTASSEKPPSRSRMLCYLKRTSLICLEIFVVVVIVGLIAAGAAVWKLSSGPVDVAFAERHLESAINAEIRPYKVDARSISLDWDNIFERPTFVINEVAFLNSAGQSILNVNDIILSLSRSALLFGDIMPRRIVVNGLDLHLVHRENGDVQMGFVSGPELTLFNASLDTDLSGSDFSALVLDRFYNRHIRSVRDKSILSGLKLFAVRDATMVYENIESGQALSLPDVDAGMRLSDETLRVNGQVRMPPSAGAQEDGVIFVQSTYNVEPSTLETTLSLKEFNPFLWSAFVDVDLLKVERSSLLLNGKADVTFSNKVKTTAASVDITSSEGKLVLPDYYKEEFPVQKLAIKADYDASSQEMRVSNSLLKTQDVTLSLAGAYPLGVENKGDYAFPFSVSIDRAPLPAPKNFFPEGFKKEKLYEVLTEQITEGTAKDVNLDFVISVRDPAGIEEGEVNQFGAEIKPVNIKSLNGSFGFENLTMDYKEPLMPVEEASGSAVINHDEDELVITSDSARVQDVAISDARIRIGDLFYKGQNYIDVDLKLDGPLQTIFAYLEREPIGLDDEFEFDVDGVKGTASGDLHIEYMDYKGQKLDPDEVTVVANGSGQGVFIPGLVDGLDVSEGNADLTIEKELMTVKGSARLKNRPVDFTCQQYIESEGKPFKMKVEAGLRVGRDLRDHFGVDVADFMEGTAYTNLTFTKKQDDRADVSIRSDLQAARIFLEPLGYEKPAGQAATLTLDAALANEEIQSVRNLNITGPRLNIENGELNFSGGDISEGTFPDAEIGATMASIEFSKPEDEFLVMNITGQRLDVSGVLGNNSDNGYNGPAVQASVAVTNMLLPSNETVRDAKLYLDMQRNGDLNEFELDGMIGRGDVFVRFEPDENTRQPALRAQMNDAGAALRALDIYQNVQGGRLTITGLSSSDFWQGNLSGDILMENFSVRNAPVLAQLINALSLPGMAELLGNQGIVFGRMEANFEWLSRPQGSLINLRQGRTSGSELGLTFSGIVDRASDTMDISGTIVPASTFNNLIGNIPIIGDILIGGRGALIAATYSIEGPIKNPEIFINPLSVLAPGILRKIFFEE